MNEPSQHYITWSCPGCLFSMGADVTPGRDIDVPCTACGEPMPKWAVKEGLAQSELPAWAKSEGQWEREIAAAERRGYVKGLEAARMSVDGALMRVGEEEGVESMKQTAWVEAPLAIQRLLDRAREGE